MQIMNDNESRPMGLNSMHASKVSAGGQSSPLLHSRIIAAKMLLLLCTAATAGEVSYETQQQEQIHGHS